MQQASPIASGSSASPATATAIASSSDGHPLLDPPLRDAGEADVAERCRLEVRVADPPGELERTLAVVLFLDRLGGALRELDLEPAEGGAVVEAVEQTLRRGRASPAPPRRCPRSGTRLRGRRL